MLPQHTIAVYCQSIEDAAYAADLVKTVHPRLFIVIGDDEPLNNWLNPKDALLCLTAGPDGNRPTATRCALLFAPSYSVVFVDTTIDNWSDGLDVEFILTEVNKHGWCEVEGNWGINKQHATTYGFPGSGINIGNVAPGNTMSADEAGALLSELVPMFDVYVDQSFNRDHKQLRRALGEHFTTFSIENPSVIFTGDVNAVEKARKTIKLSGKVVCLGDGPEGFEREFFCEETPVRIYQADVER